MCNWRVVLLGFVLAAASAAQKGGAIDSTKYYDRGMNALLGSGVSHNDQTALQLLKTSAELGHLPAQTVVGYFTILERLLPSNPDRLRSGTAKQRIKETLWVRGCWDVFITRAPGSAGI